MAVDPASLDQISVRMRRRNLFRKLSNLMLCLVIVVFGIASTAYKVRYEGGFLTCFREMTVCATVLTSVTSAALVFQILYEIRIGSEVTPASCITGGFLQQSRR